MKNSIYLFIGLLLFAISCSSDTTEGEAGIKKKVEESPLVERYMSEMVANPKTQNDIDRNLIINKLIDNGWDFQKTASGIYYSIDPVGVGEHPKYSSKVRISKNDHWAKYSIDF